MKTKSCLCLIAVFVALGISQEKPEWDSVSVFKVNVERPHASMMVYPSSALAAKGDRSRSPWFHSMNGEWKFNCADSPAKRPAGFFRQDFDDSAWRTIPVPSNYQFHGCDIPIYTNVAYPFPMNTERPAGGSQREELRRLLQKIIHHPERLDRTPDLRALRWSRFRILSVGERREGRLQRRQPHCRRVQYHAIHKDRQESDGCGSLSVQRRCISRKSGHVPPERHLSRCISMEHREPAYPRF